jgi:hypothetical protein
LSLTLSAVVTPSNCTLSAISWCQRER